MFESFYKSMVERSPHGFAYHKIICNSDGIPYDYEFLEVNASFEMLTGLNGSEIINKRVTEVLTDIKRDPFDWIGLYGEVALNGGEKEFEQYSKDLNKWYRIFAFSPEKSYFAILISDITKQMHQLSVYKNMAILSEEFLQMTQQELNYQKFTDDFLKITGAKYAVFNLFEEDGECFTTKAISGEKGVIQKAVNKLGFKLKDKKWDRDLVRAEKIKDHTITRFSSMTEISAGVIPESLLIFLEKTFKVGQVVLVKIMRNNTMLGDFTLIMAKDTLFEQDTAAEIYSRQLGLVIERARAESKIIFMNYHDQMTGLHNRRYLDKEIIRLNDEKYLPLTLIMADVNGLKLTNDVFGHKVGDMLLGKVAGIIKKACRSDDIVARVGGDEFVILLPESDAKNAEIVIGRINESIEKEKMNDAIFSLSMGYSVTRNISDDMDEVFKKAEDEMYKHKLTDSSRLKSKTIDLIMQTLYEKNNKEMTHSRTVSDISAAIASKIDGMSEENISRIRTAALLHDIGKIGIREDILNKTIELTSDERIEMQRHTDIGYRILSSVNELSEIADCVLEHHERWDGKGYPRGLRGKEISLKARIISIADAFAAMTNDIPYRKRLSGEEAIEEIKKNAGTQFDPEVARVFVEHVFGKHWE